MIVATSVELLSLSSPPEPIVRGYHTLASGSITFNMIPLDWARRFPRHPLPTVHLGRLAVDLSVQGQGIGERLLLHALSVAVEVSERIGIVGVDVFALNDRARRFYLRYGFQPLADDDLHLILSIQSAVASGLAS